MTARRLLRVEATIECASVHSEWGEINPFLLPARDRADAHDFDFPTRLAAAAALRLNPGMTAQAIRILGIDPGLRRTGWGVIDIDGNRLSFVACGSVETNDRADLAARLVAIHDGLARIIAEYTPREAAVEATFVNRDAAATLKLGQARGVAMLVPARLGVTVAEYAPNLVKKTIVGAGHCDKTQIRMMVGVLLPKADPASDDAADALAIAVTHAHHRQSVILRTAAQ
jgi:crossover junction endodeoxyribonuclease RuvC